MKSKFLSTLLGVVALAGNALAAPETYIIDGNHSMARFSYSHFGYSTQLSKFDKTSGKITLDKVSKQGSAEVTIQTSSVNTGYPLFNEHLQGEKFFDTAKYPTATFKSNKFNFTGDKLSSIDGMLTIKGVTRPVSFTVTSFMCMPHPMAKKDACGANATIVVKRSDFNMGEHVPYVSDEVTIDLPVEAIKE
jgi:polyisoprenoid-binding protein YceI